MGVLSFVFTGLLRRYALHKRLLDIPNDRSSHSVPMPRGGGLAFVVTFLAGLTLLAGTGQLALASYLGLSGAGALVAVVGFVDDRQHLAARWRLLFHFIAAGWALFQLGGMPPVSLFGATLDLGWTGHVLAAFYLVWLLNLYNFMDGIDGIAGIEGVSVCLGGAVLFWISAPESPLWQVPLLLLVTVFGFLLWNFPRARIFMGDAGSGFLGLMLGVLSLQAAWLQPQLLWAWIILLGAFITDASVTLLRRLWRGEKVSEAHRTHAYQFAARKYGSHVPISLAFGTINIIWLLPISILVARGIVGETAGLVIAYLPLIVLMLVFKAGSRETQAG